MQRPNTSNYAGFTLVEMMVIVTIIGILLATIVASVSGSGEQGRDLERQASLREVSTVIETYKRREGRYPAMNSACVSGGWAVEGAGVCREYIEGLTPLYIDELPTDPRPDGGDGFSYRTNGDGTVYKLMVRGTVEGQTVTAEHQFAPCSTSLGCSCSETSTMYQTSYAVWGGFGEDASATEAVVCEL